MFHESELVGVVVDPAFGDKLAELSKGMPVWIADTVINRRAAEHVRRDRTKSSVRGSSRGRMRSNAGA
jgi:hypothetical protein